MLSIEVGKIKERSWLMAEVLLHKINKESCCRKTCLKIISAIDERTISERKYCLTIKLSNENDYDLYRDVYFSSEEALEKATVESLNFLKDCQYAKIEWLGEFYQEYVCSFISTIEKE